MRYLSVCSGIEAASVAWHPLGWEPVAFAEVEPFPSAVLAHHYPDVPNLGDMTRYQEWPDAAIDVLVGGTPCQSFSVAGKRGGMDDPRGQLAYAFAGIAARYRPEWIVWENVPGVLSSNGGRDFAGFVRGLGELGYQCAWRVLDAQYFGVPQRRRRVFVVGCLGGWQRAAAVLFERESMLGNPPPSRKARERTAARPARSLGGGSLGTDCDGGVISMAHGQGGAEIAHDMGPTLTCNHEAPIVAHSLRGEGFDASEDGTGRGTPLVAVAFAETAPTLSVGAHGSAGHLHRQHGNETAIVGMAHAFDARQSDVIQYGDMTGPLDTDGHSVAVAIRTANTSANGHGISPELAHTLDQAQGQAVAIPIISDADRADSSAQTPSPDAEGRIRLRDPGLGIGEDGDPMFTLQATKPHAVAISESGSIASTLRTGGNDHADSYNCVAVGFAQNQRDEVRIMPVAGALAAEPGAKQQTYIAQPYTLAIRGRDGEPDLEYRQDGTANALLTLNGGRGGIGVGAVAFTTKLHNTTNNQAGKIYEEYTTSLDRSSPPPALITPMQVRRLTPVECERLQGFPDSYTAIPWRNKPADQCPDGPRYKALGNSMAVPVMRWIGRRIDAVAAIKRGAA